MPYHDVETADRATLRDRQDRRLRETVRRAATVPFYDRAGIDPDDVSGVEDLPDLPTTTKEQFRAEYPDGLFATSLDDPDLRRVHASSGTTGTPKVVGYTDADLDVWRSVMARTLHAGGVRPGDTLQNAYGYGLFTGGLGFHDGAERLGATVVPTGGGDTDRQIRFLRDLGADALACTPSYALYLAERARDRGVDLAELPVSSVLVGAEPFTDPMRAAIESRLDARAVDVYGLSEIVGPGVAVECPERAGLHVWEDHFYPEVVDPDTGERLPPGEEGELVLTTLTKEALPVVRYRTGDVTTLREADCDCGRTHRRIDPIAGRTDDLVVVRGANLYPSQVEAAVLDVDGVAPHYRIDLRRETLDRLAVTVERDPAVDGDTEALRDRVEERLAAALPVAPDEVTVADPGTLARTESGKADRVYDHR